MATDILTPPDEQGLQPGNTLQTTPAGTDSNVPLPQSRPANLGYSGDNLSCILEINGQLYRDWETVSVKIQKIETPPRTFRFTCSEGMPLVANYAKLRIRPGDRCRVRLAGIQVIYGYVTSRQVFYDAQRHYIEIQGTDITENLLHASVAHKTMEFKNVTYEQYARALLKPVIPKINFLVKGGALPQIKFPRLSIAHGTTIMEALEMPLRALGGIDFTSSAVGDLVALVKGGATGGGDVLVEGKNIIEGREIIFNAELGATAISTGQQPGTDKTSGSGAAQQVAKLAMNGLNLYRPHVMPLEVPSFSENHLKGRVNMEHDTMAKDQITVFATVHGWLRPSGGLWEVGQPVSVISPMLIMDGSVELTLKSATFTQDNAHGSRTVVELMNREAMTPGVPADAKDIAAAKALPTGTEPGSGGLPPGQPENI